MNPIPPTRAIEIAMRDSVTVSMAALMSGIRRVIRRVSLVLTSAFAGRIEDSPGTSRTSSKVRASRRLSKASIFALYRPGPYVSTIAGRCAQGRRAGPFGHANRRPVNRQGQRRMIRRYLDLAPRIDPSAWIASSAHVIGDVEIGAESSIWYGTVVRGDVFPIRIGARTNVQDHCVLHVTHERYATVLHDDITIGHRVVLHGCTVESGALVGIGAI